MSDQKYYELMKLKPEIFKRAFGVKKEVFQKMVSIYDAKRQEKAQRGGPKGKLSSSDKVLIMLEYYRDYVTQLKLSLHYGVCEGTISRTIRDVEKVLIKSGEFSLPGKKALQEMDLEFEYYVIDVTESPIQRPKKNKEDSIVERKKDIL